MNSPGLTDGQSAAELPPLPDDTPVLRLSIPDGQILAASRAVAELTGQPCELLVGRPLAELWCRSERAAIARRFEEALLLGRDAFGALALAPEGQPVAWVEVEARYVYQGGQRLEVELRPLPRPQPVSAPPTVPPGEWGAGSRQPTESAPEPGNGLPDVAAAEADTAPLPIGGEASAGALAMSALEAAGVCALAVNAHGLITSATPEVESVLGMPIARLRGMQLEQLFSLSSAAAAALEAARRGRARQSVLADLASGEGRVVLEWVPAYEPGAGFSILAADQPASEATERQRLQARLVSFVAHDVRESLTAVHCGLCALEEELPPEAPQRATLERVLSESARANRIVDDVLAVTRPGRLTRVELDLAGVLHETMDRFRSRAAEKGVQVQEILEPGIRVLADLSSLDRAFGNLIENALQAMPDHGRLTIRTRREDRARPGVRISISDTGVGVRPDIRPNVFEPFVTDKAGGTGLGLAITRRMVLDHDGQIDLESQEGQGTTFHVWLPTVEAAAPEAGEL